MINDSGERTEFDTGAVRDMHEGKGRYDLLPWEAIWEVSKHCENGAVKYGEHNVDKGIPVHSLFDSGIRHAVKWWLGWRDEPHLIAAHEVFQLGPGRAQAFANAYSNAMNELADLFISDCDENHDKQIVYAKAKRDELIRSIVGEANFVPFDVSYGNAVMDELKRVRVIEGK